jgi:hypothetical protein
MRLRPVAAVCAILLSAATAQDLSPQGLVFDRWIRDTFFGGYRPANNSQRWDIPASANSDHGGVPVNVKTARLGGAVDLGDALRQYEIDEPFMLVIGFWQPDADTAHFVNLVAPAVSPEQWRKLWGSVTYSDLQRLDALIKDTGPTVEEIRRRALAIKNSPPFSEAIIQVNPRIDERGPRRLQCSLRFQDVFTQLAPEANPGAQERPSLFGIEYPGPAIPKPRPSKQD